MLNDLEPAFQITKTVQGHCLQSKLQQQKVLSYCFFCWRSLMMTWCCA